MKYSLPVYPVGKLAVVDANVTYKSANMLNAATTITIYDRDGDGLNDSVTFDFGDITNIPDSIRQGPDDIIKVQVIAVVAGNNTAGTTLTSNASMTYNGTMLPYKSMYTHKCFLSFNLTT